MNFLNKTATQVFEKLIALQEATGEDCVKVNNAEGLFMYLSFERLCEVDLCGQRAVNYSMAHYYEQNGDLVPDPDMSFYFFKVNNESCVVPATFQNSRYYRESIYHDGKVWKINKKEQADEVSFANVWLKNIKQQQGL